MQNKDFILLKWKLKSNKEDAWIKVSGTSMFPILEDEDNVLLLKEDKYVVGDILVFAYGEKLIIHRCICLDSDGYVCKGDNAINIERISSKDILGRVVMLERSGKRFLFINGFMLKLLLRIRYKLESLLTQTIKKRKSFSLFLRKSMLHLICKCNLREAV